MTIGPSSIRLRWISQFFILVSLIAFAAASMGSEFGKVPRATVLLIEAAAIFCAGLSIWVLAWKFPGWYGIFARILSISMLMIAIIVSVATLRGTPL